MRMISQRNSNYTDEENPYWVSFSDIMAALLVIFILAAIALILELTQKKAEWDQSIQEIAKAESTRREILREIEEELKRKNIPVELSDNDTVLRIPEDALTFKSGSFDVPSDDYHKNIVIQIGKTLYSAITKESRWKYLDTIFIEGHTDKRRFYNRRLKGNWGLSTFRAISVWNYWDKNLPKKEKLSSLINHDNKPLFSVSGYAETRPTTLEQLTVDQYKKNRRIDIRFTVRRPSLEEYQAIEQQLN